MAATKHADMVALPMLDDPSCAPLPEVIRPTTEQIARLKALGDETRLTLVLTLINAGDAVCACNLVPAAGVGQATVSHHLKVLREAGLVTVERRGIWAHYRIAPDAAVWLRATLDRT
jgi:ArsR family transcriptional regulator